MDEDEQKQCKLVKSKLIQMTKTDLSNFIDHPRISHIPPEALPCLMSKCSAMLEKPMQKLSNYWPPSFVLNPFPMRQTFYSIT